MISEFSPLRAGVKIEEAFSVWTQSRGLFILSVSVSRLHFVFVNVFELLILFFESIFIECCVI